MSDADYHEGWHDAIQSALQNANMIGLMGGDLHQFLDWLHEQLKLAKEVME